MGPSHTIALSMHHLAGQGGGGRRGPQIAAIIAFQAVLGVNGCGGVGARGHFVERIRLIDSICRRSLLR